MKIIFSSLFCLIALNVWSQTGIIEGTIRDANTGVFFKAQQPPQYVTLKDSNGNPLINPNDPSRYQLKKVENLTGTVVPSFGIVIEI